MDILKCSICEHGEKKGGGYYYCKDLQLHTKGEMFNCPFTPKKRTLESFTK